jgi:hypothetical protein
MNNEYEIKVTSTKKIKGHKMLIHRPQLELCCLAFPEAVDILI